MSDQAKSAIDLAYELAVDSYEPLIKRLDAIDVRLQNIMGFAGTNLALVTSVASARNLSFRSFWFWAAVAAFLLIIAIGTVARHYGTVIMIDPASLDDEWLALEPNEFKESFIKHTGKNWSLNNNLVSLRWKVSVWIGILFFIQILFLIAWIVVLRF